MTCSHPLPLIGVEPLKREGWHCPCHPPLGPIVRFDSCEFMRRKRRLSRGGSDCRDGRMHAASRIAAIRTCVLVEELVSVNYENLCGNTWKHIARICEFIGSEYARKNLQQSSEQSSRERITRGARRERAGVGEGPGASKGLFEDVWIALFKQRGTSGHVKHSVEFVEGDVPSSCH